MTDAQLREAFEAWMSDGGTWARAIERDGRDGYVLMQTQFAWNVWQACASYFAPRERVMREALRMAGQLVYWHHFGECRVYGTGPIPSPAEVDAAIRSALLSATTGRDGNG